MDFLWTPWRYRYIAGARTGQDDRCIFCEAQKMDDAKALIVLRGKFNFVILNAFPYTSGHVMVVPYAHIGDLAECPQETLAEMMQMAQRVQGALAGIYKPEGYNLGMNLGRCAGAGITDHIHMHVLPRWTGDTNFMTTVSETRMEPEDLSTTYTKLRHALSSD
jgi:ATP adenylyltransferase